MKIILFWPIFVATSLSLIAQVPTFGNVFLTANTDSLAQTLPHKTGAAKLSTLLSLCKSLDLWETSENGSNIYVNQLKEQLRTFAQAKGHYFYFFAKQQASKNKEVEAYNYSKLAYEYYKSQGDTTGMVSALLNLGTLAIVREMGAPINIQFGRQHLEQAMTLSKSSSNPELKLLYIYVFTRFVGREGFSAQSSLLIHELKKGINIIEQNPQYTCYQPFLLNMLAAIYESKQQIEESYKYTFDIFKLLQKYRSSKVPIATLYNLGFFSENLKNYKQALFYYQLTMKKAQASGEVTFGVRYHVSMGIHASLVGLHKYQEASIWADSVYTYAEKNNQSTLKNKLQNAIVEYEVEKKEARTKALEQEKRLIEAQNRLYIIVAIAIAFLLLVAALLLYRLRRANSKLQKAYDEILLLHQTRDYFFGIIAHDLRSPLNSFQEMAEVITFYLNTKRYDELKKISISIDQMGLRIRILLDNLLSWALSQRNEVPYSPENLLLYDKILPIIDLYQHVISYKHAKITVECPTDLAIYMDSNACDLIIRNLVDNASKNLKKDGEIHIKATYNETNNLVELTIEDNGPGMSPEKLDQVSNTLHHPEISQNSPRGLGMILIGRFLKRNHISFGVKSLFGQGTTFSLMIPSTFQQL